MRIFSKKALKQFWESRIADAELARDSLTAWAATVRYAEWKNFESLRQTNGRASQVGHCVVFNVSGNHFRLIALVNYRMRIVFVRKVMDHKEYDKNRWPEECGCLKPPPHETTARRKEK